MLRHILFSVILFIFYSWGKAQLLDSFKVVIKSKSSIDLRLESRYSFINNDLASITGIRAGVSFRRKLKLGGGISWLKSNIVQTQYLPNDYNVVVSTSKYLKLGYICLYADFVFYKTKRWQVSVPVQTGFGMSWLQKEIVYNLNSSPKYFFILYEPGISSQFKIFRWFGLGVDVGYRFAAKNNKYLSNTLNSPTYAFKILFWADQLFYELFPKSKLSEKLGPAVL